MKTLILTIILFLIVQYSYSQIDSLSKINLENIIRNIIPAGTIVYTNRVSKDVLSRHFKYLKKTRISGMSSDTKQNSIVLTKQERNYLLSQLEKCFNSYWQDSLFAKSKLIDLDSVSSFLAKKHEEIWQAVFFSFSDIIYLRDKSIFLNYCIWYNGHGGAEYLYFYRKEDGAWKKWISVSGGDW